MNRSPAERALAHELSNQLGIVISYAELLREELDAGSPQLRQMATIEQAARDLLNRFDGLASLSRIRPDERREYRDRLAAIRQACESVLAGVAATDPMTADVREMIKATEAVAALVKVEARSS